MTVRSGTSSRTNMEIKSASDWLWRAACRRSSSLLAWRWCVVCCIDKSNLSVCTGCGAPCSEEDRTACTKESFSALRSSDDTADRSARLCDAVTCALPSVSGCAEKLGRASRYSHLATSCDV